MLKNWGNWSYNDLKATIEKVRANGDKTVSIDQEHTDFLNNEQVKNG